MATTPTVKALFEHAVHYGHPKDKRNPRMNPYIYGLKEGIHIINLEETLKKLQEAHDFIKRMSLEGRTFMFVGTKPQASKVVRDLLKDLPAYQVTKKWPGGLLTNFSTMKGRIQFLKDMREQEKTGDWKKYTKKEVSIIKKEVEKLEDSLGGVVDMERLPDVIVIIDACKERLAIKEAKKLGIPVIGIVDTNGDPSELTFAIPGNDDTIKSLSYLMGYLVEGYAAGVRKK